MDDEPNITAITARTNANHMDTVDECNEIVKLFGRAAHIMSNTLSGTVSPNVDELKCTAVAAGTNANHMATVEECNEIVKLFGCAAHIMRDTLSRTVSPNTRADNTTYRTVVLQDLFASYKVVCKATVEFERNATTLRTDSTALTLCRKLVSEDIPSVIAAYKHIPGYDLPLPLELGATHSYEEFDRSLNVLRRTCSKLLAELDGIDVVTPAKSYYDSTYEVDFPGVRTLPKDNFLKNSHERAGLGKCCAYLDYVSKELVSPGVKAGLEVLIKKQDHFRNSFMDMATIATFFSSITATTLQFSFANADTTGASTGVNVCWFASLILSIASAANSFVGAIVYQTPDSLCQSKELDRQLFQKWFAYAPPMLLTFAGLLFLIGICVFTFSHSSAGSTPGPSQGEAIQIITNSLTALNFLALFAIFMVAFKIMKLHLLIRNMFSLFVVFSLITFAFLPALAIAVVLWFRQRVDVTLLDCLFWNLGGEKSWPRVRALLRRHWKSLRDDFEILDRFLLDKHELRVPDKEENQKDRTAA